VHIPKIRDRLEKASGYLNAWLYDGYALKRYLCCKEVAMKQFNTEGVCRPDYHYMVKTDKNLAEIKSLIDRNKYIVINRPRQFGKTTTLNLLKKVLEPQYAYIKISIEDFTESEFTEVGFCEALNLILSDYFKHDASGLSEEAKMLSSQRMKR
jgi:hypothetical protein